MVKKLYRSNCANCGASYDWSFTYELSAAVSEKELQDYNRRATVCWNCGSPDVQTKRRPFPSLTNIALFYFREALSRISKILKK